MVRRVRPVLDGWVVFLNATRRSLGLLGVVLAVALCGGVIWQDRTAGLVAKP